MCTLRSFKHRVQRRPLFLIQQRFHAILVELSPTPCAYSHSCVSPRSHPGAGLTIDFLSSFPFFFRFLEFSLESSSPKRSCQIPPKTASNNTQRIVSLYNANSRKTTRPRETSESRDSYTLPSSSVDRSILSRLQTSTRGGNPTSRAPNLFHAIPEERTARYKVCIENDKGSIRFYGRGETEFTQVFDALSLSLPSRRSFSRFRASTLLPLT